MKTSLSYTASIGTLILAFNNSPTFAFQINQNRVGQPKTQTK